MSVYRYPITSNLIDGLPQNPYRNGVGAYEGVVLHYTDNEQDTAIGEASYEASTWQNAFVHFFIDAKGIVQVADTKYSCWGCGPIGNPRFVQIEMCHADNQDAFNLIFDQACELIASLLADRKLGVSLAPNGTLWSHADVSNFLGGTDHTDPIAWLQRWGKTWQDVIDKVTAYYKMIIAESPAPILPPPTTPTPKTPILGKAVATVDQMRLYLKSKNPDAPDNAQMYLDIGAKYGIRGDLAFCQSIKETAAWRFCGQVSSSQNNFAGIGALNGGAAGATFKSAAEGIEAQIQHLFGYATSDSLPSCVTLVDPRFDILQAAGKRGVAPNWEDLDGKWAVPGVGYGESVVAMWNEMCAIKLPSESEMAIKWAQDNGIIKGDETGFNPGENVTREQLAIILHRFADKFRS